MSQSTPSTDGGQPSLGPVLPAYAATDTDGIHWWVWCEHERRWHKHGAGEGVRASHCLCPKAPRHYVLRYAGEFTTEVRKQHGRQLSRTPFSDSSSCWPGSCRFDRLSARLSAGWPAVDRPSTGTAKITDEEIVAEALREVLEECDRKDIRDVVQTAVSVALTRVREGS